MVDDVGRRRLALVDTDLEVSLALVDDVRRRRWRYRWVALTDLEVSLADVDTDLEVSLALVDDVGRRRLALVGDL